MAIPCRFIKLWHSDLGFRDSAIEDSVWMGRTDFIKKYHISPRMYRRFFKKLYHKDNKNTEEIKEKLMIIKSYHGFPSEAIDIIRECGVSDLGVHFRQGK